MQKITIKTTINNELIDITDTIRDAVRSAKVKEGICLVYCPHTTAAVTINENCDPAVKTDILAGLSEIAPNLKEYEHSEGNSDAHVKSSLMGISHMFIVSGGVLRLGQWQGIFFTEFDGPRKREIWIQIVSN